jgi:hypothetical protein
VPTLVAQLQKRVEDRLRNTRTQKKKGEHEIDWISLDLKAGELKLCIDTIQQTTKLFPKNHRLGLTQTPKNIQIVAKNEFSSQK